MLSAVVVKREMVRSVAVVFRGTISAYFKRFSFPALFVVALFAASPALAALCSNSSLVSQDFALKRQLTAITTMERSRKCTAESAQGGFFNVCRDLARRRANIQSKLRANSAVLARCSGSTAASKLEAKTPPPVQIKKTESARPSNKFLGRYSGTPLLFCVRLSDGYYFPAPHSQFAKSDQIKEALAHCRFICETPDVNLYVLNDPAAENSGMVSVDKRATYGSLPTAYRYQSDRNFKKCNWARYNSYIQHVKNGREKPKKPKSAMPVEAENVNNAIAEEPAPDRDLTAEFADRNIRIVGPEFLQQGNDKLINFETERQHTDAGMQVDKSIE